MSLPSLPAQVLGFQTQAKRSQKNIAYEMWEECTAKCCSRKHADSIFSAIAAGREYEETAVKLLATCSNIATNKDSLGRTGLQIAASFGSIKIMHWLCSHEAHINSKDDESGYSALHRSFYFGQLQASRVLLLKNASLFQTLDNDSMSPFDHLIQDRSDFERYDPYLPCEVYVWGSNSNFGLGKQQSPEMPELLDAFPKGSRGIKQVVMNKFHSVFVTLSGQAFSCGVGQGGKLGLGSEATVIIPQNIKLETEYCLNSKFKKSTVIVEVALGTNHSILLTETGNVFSFGVNTYHQLGHNPPPSHLVAPKVLSYFEDKSKEVMITHVCASRHHSVFWCLNNLYTCGLNAGALGHNKGEKTITTPKRVPLLSEQMPEIMHVSASDGATAIATGSGHVYVLHEYQCRKIASKQYDLAKIVMVGGKLDFPQADLVVENIPLQVLLLTKSGKVFIWSQTNPVLTRCSFRGSPFCVMTDIALCKNSLAFVSREGEAFTGTITNTLHGKKKVEGQSTVEKISTRLEFTKREQLVQITIQRIPGIHRATSITCDPSGKNFAVTQVKPNVPMQNTTQVCVPPSRWKADLKQLFLDADPLDLIHDIVFVVGSKRFAAHGFILSANCNTFYLKVCVPSRSLERDDRTFVITEVPTEVFRLILEFVYTGTCAIFEKEEATWNRTVLHSEKCMDQFIDAKKDRRFADQKTISDEENSDDKEGPWCFLRMVQFHAKNLGIHKLAEMLEKAHISNSGVVRNDQFLLQPKHWSRFSGEIFYDTKLLSDDGKEFNAHRVVLASRSDYFHSMFGYVWVESVVSKEIRLPIHSVVLDIILDYIYEDRAIKVENSEDVDWISNCLVSADLLLLPRLVSICESALVGLLAIKNVGKILDFATMYNAIQLKTSCMYFMCYNLPAVVELRLWNCLDESVMKNLTDFYQQFNPRIRSRVPTVTVHRTLAGDHLNLQAMSESLADVTLSSFKREREVKKKKLRKKSGKKGNDLKDYHQPSVELTELTSNMKPVNNSVCLKNEGWSKVDKPKRRNKSLNHEIPPTDLSPGSSQKTQIQDKSNMLLGVRSKELEGYIKGHSNLTERTRANSSSEPGGSPEKQSNLTLFEMATTVFQTAISPENEKTKKFRKLSQKQRKLQEAHSMAATENAALPWNSLDSAVDTSSKDVTYSPVDNAKAALHSEDPVNSPPKIQSVWRSPDKTANVSSSQICESEESSMPLQHIIAKEKLQRKNLIRISTKPLKFTLIEEKAIEDLTKFYGADQVDDEFILVERISSLAPAVPIWSSGKDNNSNRPKPKFRSFSMSESGI